MQEKTLDSLINDDVVTKSRLSEWCTFSHPADDIVDKLDVYLDKYICIKQWKTVDICKKDSHCFF